MSPEPEQQHAPAFVADAPRDVAVVGAGMVGLSTAWFLQEAGVHVTVYERHHVGSGASWGNAGWLTPGLTAPLPEPAVLRYGLRAVLSPRSPVYLPLRADRGLARFLTSFVAHSTARQWRRGMAAYVPLNERALEAFDVLAAGGVAAQTTRAGSFLACFAGERDARGLLAELEQIRDAGQEVSFHPVTGWRARALEPALTNRVAAAIQIYGQRYLDPPEFVRSLAEAVRARGGEIVEGVEVADLRPRSGSVSVLSGADERQHDAVVVATGALLGGLTARFGVRQPVQAGRGYSFSVPVRQMPRGPLYFPTQRVACTPLGDRLRVAGMMEFRRPGDPLDPRRITAIVDAVRPFLTGVDLDDRRDEWVGSRPCTPDGLPLAGVTASPRVFVAGGHGMWGIALGPVTGQLMAQTVLKGEVPPELAPFDPLR
ncbi:D-amino acid dehydrogenase small subunit [Micromonospora sp. MW-13]|uniref:NAD(P)/FAD-dependent oxidoreductase n=1 Tax=Micromonospora sp. MW-13 TaxID=2094022 RepID=UPI000E43EA3D|nr:FAD-dependent oxidoreductase [Micromonospora sp. MW-13]RGC69298.1 D-amino acid dehydrogenase small subunit [Micromonospora sp. MW-13]